MTGSNERPLTKNIDLTRGALDVVGYERAGGYLGARKIATGMDSSSMLGMVKDSGLKGRGGAGFPTGLKWSFVPQGPDSEAQKYLVVNADEMEPGTFKDRMLMEGDPHLLIAIVEAREKGYLGENIFGSDFSFDIVMHTSAGRYICGEETALLNALEGKRANPRAKPPFPQVSGLWGKPTIVNNVETICNLPGIMANGIDWYQSIGSGGDFGTKLFGLSGRVKNPGCWELPLGVTIREVIEEYGGGMQDGYSLKAFLPGGGSTDFLTPEHLDTELTYDAIGKLGSPLATGTMILLDDKTCPVGMIGNLMKFFSHESCGFCTPCRDGLPWVDSIFEEFERGGGTHKDLAILHDHVDYMGPGKTFCALAPGATAPLGSGLKLFEDEFEAHIKNRACPYKH